MYFHVDWLEKQQQKKQKEVSKNEVKINENKISLIQNLQLRRKK